MKTSLALYIHIPWCVKKCPYCDFNSHEAKSRIDENKYIDTLIRDLEQQIEWLAQSVRITSIFIGGGTPSLFAPESFQRLLEQIAQYCEYDNEIEITLEANPGTVDNDKFAAFRQAGINRLSIGIQSFNDTYLQKLGRIHDALQAKGAIEKARHSGFDNINLDLMFGLPGQTALDLQNDIKTAIRFAPEHLSYYQLTLEPNTYFYRHPPRLPAEDLIVTGQEQAQQQLALAGYEQYEVSAYAKPGYASRHNCNYWRFGDYIGIGAGAHGKLSLHKPQQIVRTRKAKNPKDYSADFGSITERILPKDLPLEFLMNQLRLKTGFALAHFESATGLASDELLKLLQTPIEQGLLIKNDSVICCSEQGFRFLDSILEALL